MLQGVNTQEELNNAKLNQQLGVSGVVTNPINNPYKNIDRNLLIDESSISDVAVNLYQKEQDIKNFTKLAMSNPEDASQDEIISGIFNKGASDIFSDETFESITNSQKFLEDIGF